jgi:hypothetical protein
MPAGDDGDGDGDGAGGIEAADIDHRDPDAATTVSALA